MSPQPPPGLEKYARQYASYGKPVKAAPVRPRLCTSISVTPHSHMSVPPKWDHILCAQLLPTREVQVPPLREPTNLSVQILVQGLVVLLNREPLFFLWSYLVNPKMTGSVTLTQLTVVSCIINTVSLSLFFSGIQGRPAGTTNIIAAACGKFHAVILQEASEHVPHISDQFIAYTGNTNLAILLNKDTFEPDPMVFDFKEASTRKVTWGMVLLIVRGLLRRPSLSGTPTVTFCSVHIRNVVAKKRDASTDLLHRLHGYMEEHNVDFIGGDFNMSAFSTVGDVFSDTAFSAPGNSLLWDLVHWRSRIVSALGFSSCQSVHTTGVWIQTAATNSITPHLALDPEIKPFTFLFFSTFAPPTYLTPTASCAVSKHNKEGLSADITNTSVCGDDVLVMLFIKVM